MASSLPPTVARLIKPNPLAQHYSRTLYETLSRMPKDGVGARLTQPRWAAKGIPNCYWEVTKVRIKDEGRHGKAWGRLFWKGESYAASFFPSLLDEPICHSVDFLITLYFVCVDFVSCSSLVLFGQVKKLRLCEEEELQESEEYQAGSSMGGKKCL